VKYLDRLLSRAVEQAETSQIRPGTLPAKPSKPVLGGFEGTYPGHMPPNKGVRVNLQNLQNPPAQEPAQQHLNDDVFIVTDDEPELTLVESEPCPRLACCAAHASGKQTPDARWWCWKAVATVTAPDSDPSPAVQCRREAMLWAEYAHQDPETGRWRPLETQIVTTEEVRPC
jgi:hypothetical protein